MKTYGGVEVSSQLHAPADLLPGEQPPEPFLCIGEWMDVVEKRKIPFFYGESKYDSSVF
jgi:hypothetical protein